MTIEELRALENIRGRAFLLKRDSECFHEWAKVSESPELVAAAKAFEAARRQLRDLAVELSLKEDTK